MITAEHMGSSRSARCCRSSHPPTAPMPQSGLIPPNYRRARSRMRSANRDQACLREELRRLRRTQGLAATAPRGRGYRTMHRGATDAEHGPARRDPGKASQNHDQRQGRPVSAGSCQPPVPSAQAERALGLGLHLCRDLDRFRLRRVRDRRLRSAHRGLACITDRACERTWTR